MQPRWKLNTRNVQHIKNLQNPKVNAYWFWFYPQFSFYFVNPLQLRDLTYRTQSFVEYCSYLQHEKVKISVSSHVHRLSLNWPAFKHGPLYPTDVKNILKSSQVYPRSRSKNIELIDNAMLLYCLLKAESLYHLHLLDFLILCMYILIFKITMAYLKK